MWGTRYQVIDEKQLGSRQSLRATASSNKGYMKIETNYANFDVEPHLDFRALGKSTKSNVDHSKFHCILPYTSLKQPSMKLNYVRHLQDEGRKIAIEEENQYGNTTKWANTVQHHKTIRPLYEDTEKTRQQFVDDFSIIVNSIKRKSSVG